MKSSNGTFHRHEDDGSSFPALLSPFLYTSTSRDMDAQPQSPAQSPPVSPRSGSPVRATTFDSIASDAGINYAEIHQDDEGVKSEAQVNPDGRINVSLNLAKKELHEFPDDESSVEEFGIDKEGWKNVPPMSIVIMIVGSRGDVQPYVALGKELIRDGHRVRLATHETFRDFVTGAGLEFFNIGGNPADLMSYMVKNPGLIPGIESLTNGDIGRKRRMLNEMIHGCWKACYSADPHTGRPFAADAIISNPPAFAHIHCAEAIGIPLQLSFTMPWTPTGAFPNPLVNITSSNATNSISNHLSYSAANLLIWKGVGDIINHFRTTTLGLPALSILNGPGIVDRLKVPWTYCMSPALVPKPKDWKNLIDVVGFYFLDLATDYKPSPDLEAFLAAGEPPIYVGFGSVVVDDPAAMSKIIFEATHQAGVRALVSAGWGGLGGVEVPPHIFMLDNIPHDWLFSEERVAAVVHHGGAGTMAIGLAKGRPTVVIPFFGDQGFWGHMVHKAGAGPRPIPQRDLSVKKLVSAIKFAMSPSAKAAAGKIAEQINEEDGVRRGVDSFYQHLPLLNMRCDLNPAHLAVWWSPEYALRLSALAAQVLSDAGLLDMQTLILYRSKQYRHLHPKPSYRKRIKDCLHLTHSHTSEPTSPKSPNMPRQDVGGIRVKDIETQTKKEIEKAEKRAQKEARRAQQEAETWKGHPLKHLEKEMGKKGEVAKNKVKGFALTKIGPIVLPMNSFKNLHSERCNRNFEIRLARMTEGHIATKASTPAERQQIIDRFQHELLSTPVRQKQHADIDAAQREDEHDHDGGSSTDSVSDSEPSLTRSGTTSPGSEGSLTRTGTAASEASTALTQATTISTLVDSIDEDMGVVKARAVGDTTPTISTPKERPFRKHTLKCLRKKTVGPAVEHVEHIETTTTVLAT